VHHAPRVRVGQRARHVAQDPDDVGHPHRSGGDARAQRLAGDVRHHEIRMTVDLAGAQHGHDVRVLQPRREEDLPAEPVHGDRRRQLLPHQLDDDAPLQPRVVGDEDARHPATRELALDGVAGTQRLGQQIGQCHGVELDTG
jgi:hypothetical protein